MKKFFGSLFLAIAFCGSANAQLLYKISGNGLKSPSYIVGTYHLAPASFADEIKGMNEAFAAVEQVYGEVDMQDVVSYNGAMLSAMMLPEGKYISDMFTAEEMAQMLALAAKGAAHITAVQKAAIARADEPSASDFNSLKDFFAKK